MHLRRLAHFAKRHLDGYKLKLFWSKQNPVILGITDLEKKFRTYQEHHIMKKCFIRTSFLNSGNARNKILTGPLDRNVFQKM